MTAEGSLVQQIFSRAFEQGELDSIDELCAAECVTHMERWGIPAGRTGLKLFASAMRSAFPDLRCTVEQEINEQDKLAAHWTLRGTHHGLFLGNPPTGRGVDVKGILFARASDGQIIEIWMLIDQFGILQQLGIVPPPHQLSLKNNQGDTLSEEKDKK